MLYCPARSPANFSSRLPGGTRKSSSAVAASSWTNLRRTARWNERGIRLTTSRLKRRSVCSSAKQRIMGRDDNGVRYYGQALLIPRHRLIEVQEQIRNQRVRRQLRLRQPGARRGFADADRLRGGCRIFL